MYEEQTNPTRVFFVVIALSTSVARESSLNNLHYSIDIILRNFMDKMEINMEMTMKKPPQNALIISRVVQLVTQRHVYHILYYLSLFAPQHVLTQCKNANEDILFVSVDYCCRAELTTFRNIKEGYGLVNVLEIALYVAEYFTTLPYRQTPTRSEKK